MFDVHCILFSQLIALKSCHDRNITHRDIKPGESTSHLSELIIMQYEFGNKMFKNYRFVNNASKTMVHVKLLSIQGK
jgi:serine/threonine protein kinase